MQDEGNGPDTSNLVMPLQNGTQKDVGLGPDFRRDDEWVGFELSPNDNKGLQLIVLMITKHNT